MKPFIRSLAVASAFLCGSLAVPAFAQDVAAGQAKPAATTPLFEQESILLQKVDVFHGAGILIFQTPDGNLKWWLDGRMMLDAAMYDSDVNTLANGVEIRRARLALNMVLLQNWASQFDVEYIQDATIEIKDMWIGYTGIRNSMIQIGNFKEPFGLETLTSSRYISFIERSLIDNFSPDRHIGAAFAKWNKRMYGSGGIFGPTVGSTDSTGQDQGYGVVGRVTALPVLTRRALVHVGIAGSYLTPNAATAADLSDANQMRLRARPETHVNRGRFIDTKKMSNIDHQNLIGVEAAAEFGPVSVQSEYNKATYTRTVSTLPQPTFDGWYAYVSWFPTGDHRPYDYTGGQFDRVLPDGKRGALELLARYSTADLNDPNAGILGGKEEITTLGANWYVNPNVRLMVNYARVVNDENAKGDRSYKVSDRFNTLQARFQLMF
jgi:phosphate-selective porin OprO and OprP